MADRLPEAYEEVEDVGVVVEQRALPDKRAELRLGLRVQRLVEVLLHCIHPLPPHRDQPGRKRELLCALDLGTPAA